jgi:putative flippase GtrA
MHKFIRYSMVSGVAIVISQVTILVCIAAFGLSGIAANTIGAVAATPASYELNRKWAWGKRGKSHLWREVVPFWSLSLAGYLASTGTVQLADNMAKSNHMEHFTRALLIMGASLLAYGVIWIVKFVVLNKLFVAHAGTVEGHEAPPGPQAVANGASLVPSTSSSTPPGADRSPGPANPAVAAPPPAPAPLAASGTAASGTAASGTAASGTAASGTAAPAGPAPAWDTPSGVAR